MQRHTRPDNAGDELFKGETGSLIAAEIQNIIQDTARKSSLEISRLIVLKTKENVPVACIPIQVQFTSDTQKLLDFLAGLASGEKMLTVDKLQIRAKRNRSRRKLDDFSIWVNMIISGYRRNDLIV